jgi:hypothetical protein
MSDIPWSENRMMSELKVPIDSINEGVQGKTTLSKLFPTFQEGPKKHVLDHFCTVVGLLQIITKWWLINLLV